MSAKDKDSTLSSKLKQFFRMNKTPGTLRTDFALSAELERELHPETPVLQRCRALKELGDSVKNNRLEDVDINKLVDLTKDLILPNKPIEQRHTALVFYQKLIQGQFENLSILRGHFFRVIQEHDVPEDIGLRLSLLKTLTDNGKSITYFEESIGAFMLQWLPAIVEAGKTESCLEVLVNIVKFNAACLEKHVVVGIIQHSCYLSCSSEDPRTVLQCLQILDVALCYTVFPTETLTLCIVALCRTVNREAYCQMSWKIMKNLLGTNLGHASLLTMCNILNDPNMFTDEALLRGAVFHSNMGLWGSSGSIVPMCSPSTVLLSFLHALGSQRIIVTYEVILGIQRLINMSGTKADSTLSTKLSEPSWDVICDILYAISNNITYYEKTSGLPKEHVVQNAFHETLNIVEAMLQRNEIPASPDNFYSLFEEVAEHRSEKSVMHLIDYVSLKISATRPEWLQAMHKFMERFYRMSNVNIRVKAVQTLMQMMDINRAAYEEEILERVVIPHFCNVHHEKDIIVRTAVAKLLIDFAAHCESKRCLELLDIVEKMLNRPMELYETNKINLNSESELLDIVAIVEGLIDVFMIKLYRLPSSHAIKIFHLLIGQLERYYSVPSLMDGTAKIRYKIFNWMLRARANSTYHIGFPGSNGTIQFSHYLGLDILHSHHVTGYQPMQIPQATSVGGNSSAQHLQHQTSQPEPIPAATLSTISIRRGCKRIVECLKCESDWQIVQLVLKELPNIMQNKALLQGNDMDALANALIGMYQTKNTMGAICLGPDKPSSSDFYSMILATIGSLVPYHHFLGQRTQKDMVDALRAGLFTRRPRICVDALTVMLLEMPEMMLRHLPEVLLEMSKMSTTVNVAVPVLEFLSSLNRLPSRRFANFITVQYMYVFAISVPYTNPYKYDHYTVSLAHHVIAGWFLKCRLPLRRNFVNYIIKGFETNVQIPFQEKKMDFAQVNEDSSNRKRSSSLTEQGSRRRERLSLQSLQRLPKQDDALYNFHLELAETCIDFLARHTFSPCSALPKRLPTSEFLLAGGHALTWLVGHNLITITTSGCTSVQVKNGLCDRCSLMCKQPIVQQKGSGSTSGMSEDMSVRESTQKRYTKASLQHTSSSGQESATSTDITSSTSSSNIPTPFSQQQSTGSEAKFFRQTSSDGRFSNSSGSLEALSRRGSNPDTPENTLDVKQPNEYTSGSRPHQPVLSAGSTSAFASPQQIIDRSKNVCACSCTGWAEICIRRPTGNMSWVMRIQNQISLDTNQTHESLHDIISLFMPSLGGVFGPDFLDEPVDGVGGADAASTSVMDVRRKVSVASSDVSDTKSQDDDGARRDSVRLRATTSTPPPLPSTEDTNAGNGIVASSSGPIDIPKQTQPLKESAGSFSDVEPEHDENSDVAFDDEDSRSRNPVRRVNSSPEMSSSWRHPYHGQKGGGSTVGSQMPDYPYDEDLSMELEQQQKKKSFGKDTRLSCEAIPEEIAGSTPPSQPESVKETDCGGTLQSKLTLKAASEAMTTVKQPQPEVTAAKSTVLTQSSSFPVEAIVTASTIPSGVISPQNVPPKKQLSADDVVQLPDAPTVLGSGAPKIKLPMDMPKVTTKPPHSPAPLSPRLLAKNAANKIASFAPSVVGGGGGGGGGGTSSGSGNGNANIGNGGATGSGNGGSDMIRGRSKTISVVREYDSRENLKWKSGGTRSGISPSSVFLQLYHTGPHLSSEQPIPIGPTNQKAVALLDLIPPFETHKIGVLYVGPGQCNNEPEIFRNRYGSLRYTEFLRNLGTLVALKDAKEHNMFVNMEVNGRDGKFTYIWQDDIVQVTFHVATLMPNRDQDPHCNEKKKHIGNDFVSIVYNESGEEYNLNTIKGQFNYACVVVQPLELNSNRIFVLAKEDVSRYVGQSEPKIISDSCAALFARQLALHANLASLVAQSLKSKHQSPYASNWLERLRKIKHLRAKLLKENGTGSSSSDQSSGSGTNSSSGGNSGTSNVSPWLREDFTSYTQ